MNTLKITNTEELLTLLTEVNQLMERVGKIEIAIKELNITIHLK